MLHDPSLGMVINFTLMAFYMLASSRRNTGLLYLGIASKAATILGIHVMELNQGLRPETARRRYEQPMQIKDWRVCLADSVQD